jgi:uncharacterized protein (DUF3820 family)
MLKKIDTYTVPEWALPYLIYGETDDLSGTEENDLEQFIMQFDDYEGLVFVDKGESYFNWTNDVNGVAGTVIDVTIYGHEIEGANHA